MTQRVVDEFTLEAAIDFIRDPNLVRTGLLRLCRQDVIDALESVREVERK